MATYLGYPFDPELFLLNWKQEADPTKTALFESGAVQADAEIARLISTGGDFYTLPFYGVLDGTPENYDGATDITTTTPGGKAQSGIVYGRAHGWLEKQFVRDYNSGADPMKQITSQVAKYWNKQRQAILLKILAGIFGISNSNWANHTMNLAATSGAVGDDNKVGMATAAELAQQAVGDNAGIFTMAVMHSAVALNLSKAEQLTFRTQTDANGMQRKLNIADWNGMLVVVDDGVGVKDSTGVSGAKEYTTYILGNGAIRYADAPVEVPVETTRDAKTNGGQNELITRIRETMHPYGFAFAKPSAYAGSPTDAQLAASANWSMVGEHKNIAIARLITNG